MSCKCGHAMWHHTTRCRFPSCKCRLSWQDVKRAATREKQLAFRRWQRYVARAFRRYDYEISTSEVSHLY